MADTGGLGYKDHSPYGALGINLAFGKRPDGAVLHISEVVSGLKCDCVCPACDVRLVAHKSNTAVTKKGAKRHHFKHHHDGAACNYGPETNAHYFAKRLLEQVKWITLPERIATVDGVTRVMREKERHEFDEVIVEPRLGKIIPDLILIAKGHRLLVEVYVTHRCDDDKIAHIRTVGLSAVEVDLSAYRTSHDDEAIAAAILTDAPRAWLHNRLADSDRTKLRIENTKRQRAKEAQAEQHARRILDAIRKTQLDSERLEGEVHTVKALGRSHLVGIGNQAAGFNAPTADWQASLLMNVVILPSREGSSSFSVTPHVALAHIEQCVIPELREPLPNDVEGRLLKMAPDLVLPLEAIAAYLSHLVEAEVLEPSLPYNSKSLKVASGEKVELRRRITDYLAGDKNERAAEGRLQFVLSRLSPDDLEGFDLAAWKAQVPGFAMSLSSLCASGDDWRRFSAALHEVEAMLRGGLPVRETLGLPLGRLQAASAKAVAVKREEDARRAEVAQEAARQERVANMRNLAHRELRAEADEWLNSPNTYGLTPLENAAEGLSLERLYDEIHELGEKRRQRLKVERIAEDYRERLRAAVFPAFGHDERRANLFLNSSQPTLNGQSPSAYCRDEASLGYCLSLMARQARPYR